MARLKSTDAAIERAVQEARNRGADIVTGRVTAWSSPRATVTVGTTSIPRVYATRETWSNMAVDRYVILEVQGGIAVITGTL